jgi:hypothetical protein
MGAIIIEDFPQMVLPSFGLFGHAVSEEKNFFRLTNQKQELPNGHHRQFLFLIGDFQNIFSSQTAWPN